MFFRDRWHLASRNSNPGLGCKYCKRCGGLCVIDAEGQSRCVRTPRSGTSSQIAACQIKWSYQPPRHPGTPSAVAVRTHPGPVPAPMAQRRVAAPGAPGQPRSACPPGTIECIRTEGSVFCAWDEAGCHKHKCHEHGIPSSCNWLVTHGYRPEAPQPTVPTVRVPMGPPRKPETEPPELPPQVPGCTAKQLQQGCEYIKETRRCACPGDVTARQGNFLGALGPALGLSPYVYGQPTPWSPPLALQPHFQANPRMFNPKWNLACGR